MQFLTVLQSLGLAQNEAKIYETLLRLGKSGVSAIASSANINRRNVYDSLERLLEKNIVFAVIQGRDTLYQAVEPKKLLTLVQEKEQQLRSVLPDMTKLFKTEASPHQVMMYEGLEGWKTNLQDILLTGEDLYTIGGKGQWLDPILADFSRKVIREAHKKGMSLNVLFDASVQTNVEEALHRFKGRSAILPPEFSSKSTIDIFGDTIVLATGNTANAIDDTYSLTVIKNPLIAQSFRTWWHALWELSTPIG